ncbi:ATP-binding protein [Acinetobacter pittii]|uniref:ATP-binding protein n=1 Tax=Acinetobacter pittii TaxID=48296 RepID=A0A3G6YMC6_ACIPI|nr:ATP-binding protein [Acinetobacter pittii]
MEKFNKAIEFRKNNDGRMKFEHILSMMNVWRGHSLISEYEKLQNQNNLIFSPKNKFIETINKLFSGRKRLNISEKNELNISVVLNGNEKPIPISELSSGEKQLLIILGQALLQEEKATIFIADEPELSLHLKWQVELTKSILGLNPNAQIIFATHSPDIVAEYQNKVIRMENML